MNKRFQPKSSHGSPFVSTTMVVCVPGNTPQEAVYALQEEGRRLVRALRKSVLGFEANNGVR